MSNENTAQYSIRSGTANDLPGINSIYNHFVTETPATFDVVPITAVERASWFEHFDDTGPHRLLVAEVESRVVAFAYSKEFRQRQAYETSVETSIYLDSLSFRRGIGTRLYSSLFAALEEEDLHRVYAGITLPNVASVALHEKCGFHSIGTYGEVGRKFGHYWSVAWYEKNLP